MILAHDVSERLIILVGDDRIWELIEVSAEKSGGIMHCVVCPINVLAVHLGRLVKCFLKCSDTLAAALQSKYAFGVKRCIE